MEIHQNPLFFHENIFFLLCFFTKIFFFSFGKVRILRTLFSELIFGISCYGPLTHGTYISTPPIHGILTPYPWYIDPPILGISNPSCNNVAPVTNLCLGRATTWSHSSQWSKKKVAVET
jgi:hypothetical protein